MSARLARPRTPLLTVTPQTARTLRHVALVLGVLGLSALFALVAASERVDSVLVVAAAAALVGGVLLLRQRRAPALGLVLILLLGGLANVVSLPTGTQSRIVLSLLLALLLTGLWILGMVRERSLRLLPSPLNAPVVAWVVVSALAWAWSLALRDPLLIVDRGFIFVQAAGLVVNTLLPLLILLTIHTLGRLEYDEGVLWMRRMVWAVLGVGAVAVVGDLLNLPINHFYSNGVRGVFSMWVLALSLALALCDRRLGGWARVALLALGAAWAYRNFIQHTVWLSGWVPMAVAAAVILWFRSRRLFALAAAIVLVVAALNSHLLYASVIQSNVDEGSTSRIEIWAVALTHVARHPLFGMGPAGYAAYYMTYNPLNARSTHNNYFDIVAQTGVIGLALFLWMWVRITRVGLWLVRDTRADGSFEEALALAVLGGAAGAAVGMMLGDWVLPFAYNQTITGFDNAAVTWLLFGAAGALQVLRRARALPATATQGGGR